MSIRTFLAWESSSSLEVAIVQQASGVLNFCILNENLGNFSLTISDKETETYSRRFHAGTLVSGWITPTDAGKWTSLSDPNVSYGDTVTLTGGLICTRVPIRNMDMIALVSFAQVNYPKIGNTELMDKLQKASAVYIYFEQATDKALVEEIGSGGFALKTVRLRVEYPEVYGGGAESIMTSDGILLNTFSSFYDWFLPPFRG